MVASNQTQAIGVFSTRKEAENALNELKGSGYPMDKVSIIAKDAEENDQLSGAQMTDRVGNQNTNSVTATVADTVTAAGWGTVLVGLTSLALPGIGAVIAAGSVGVALVTSLAGAGLATVSAEALVRALRDLGIPEEHARTYGDHLHQGHYLVIMEGAENEISSAEGILSNRGIQDWSIYNSPSA